MLEVNLALIRPLYLLALGYMMPSGAGGRFSSNADCCCCARGMLAARELASTPTIDGNLRRVLDFHNAERCVLALQRTSVEPRNVMYTVARTDQRAGGAQEMTEDSGNQLLRFGDSASVLYSSPAFPGASARATCVAADRKGERESTPASSDCESTPICSRRPISWRSRTTERRHARASLPHLGSPSLHGRRGRFLLQFAAAVSKVVENLQLLDQLVSSAAEHERVMISRDIHDAAVQPYIGLRLGLEALYRDGGATSPLSQKILDLVEMANATVRDLRGYTRGLLEGSELPGGSLGAAILDADRTPPDGSMTSRSRTDFDAEKRRDERTRRVAGFLRCRGGAQQYREAHRVAARLRRGEIARGPYASG